MKLPGPPLSTYVLAHVPGWAVVCLLAWAVVAWLSLPPATGVLIIVIVLLKDTLSYPSMRRYYTPEPPERRLLDHPAVAVTPLTPRGWVRVRGELWRAHISSGHAVPAGAVVRVREVEGLVLVVEPRARAA